MTRANPQPARGVRGPLAAWIAAALLATGSTVSAQTYRGYEGPAYTVQRQDGPFELRLYKPSTVAEVAVAGDRSPALGQGFRRLAGYIFGKNADDEKIAMTSPVAQSASDGHWTVRFTMPSAAASAGLPAPSDPAVRLRTLPGGLEAVVRFSGLYSAAAFATQEAKLRDWIAAQGLTATGPAIHYYYDDPFTLPWRRRTEVAIPVR